MLTSCGLVVMVVNFPNANILEAGWTPVTSAVCSCILFIYINYVQVNIVPVRINPTNDAI